MSEIPTHKSNQPELSESLLAANNITELTGVVTAMKNVLRSERADRVNGEINGYFGACGVYNPEEARSMANALRASRKYPDRKVMIGVMTHPAVLSENVPMTEEIRAEFPTRDEMASGFIDDPDVFNTVHLADLYGPNGPRKGGEAPNVFENLELVVKYGGDNLHAIQLDITWPSSDELKRFKSKYPDIAIILQVGKFGLAEVDGDPHSVVERIREYGDSVDYILLDTSMGMGKGMNAEKLLPMLRTIRDQIPEIGLAVAGGLGPNSVDLLGPIAAEFPDISIDAEGNLKRENAARDERGHLIATEPVDLGRTTDYIQKSCAALDNPGVRQAGIPVPTT